MAIFLSLWRSVEISGIAANTFPSKPDSLFEEDYSSQKFSILLPQFLETVVISWPSTFTFSQTAASIFLRKSKSSPFRTLRTSSWHFDPTALSFGGSFKVFQGSRCFFPNFPQLSPFLQLLKPLFCMLMFVTHAGALKQRKSIVDAPYCQFATYCRCRLMPRFGPSKRFDFRSCFALSLLRAWG